MSNSELKLDAKAKLEGKRGNAALVTFIFMIVTGTITTSLGRLDPQSAQYTLISICGSLIEIFLTLGLTSYYLKISRNEDAEVGELFSKGNIFLKGVVISFLVALVVGLGCILLIVPGIILAFCYSMTTYILIDNPEVGITDAMKQSREMMNGHKMDFFMLGLSFVGWYILSFLTCGILFLYVMPYIYVATSNFYNQIKDGGSVVKEEVVETVDEPKETEE